VRPEGLGKLKQFIHPHLVSNPRPSGLQHSALITTLPCAPQIIQCRKKTNEKPKHKIVKRKTFHGKQSPDLLSIWLPAKFLLAFVSTVILDFEHRYKHRPNSCSFSFQGICA
jgi:hypothetical protein